MIGIFGDSFCDLNPPQMIDIQNDVLPWPLHLQNLVDCNVTSYGQSATSIYWSYCKFLKYYKEYEKIIFVYTEYNRWHTLKNEHLGLAHVYDNERLQMVPDQLKDVAKKLVDAHPFIFDQDFNKFVYQSIFDNVNKLCKEAGIKLVNIMPFELVFDDDKMPIDISQATGPCLSSLAKISYTECDKSSRLEKYLNLYPDLRHNHMNKYNNKVFATIVLESFSKNISLYKVTDIDKFVYDDIYLQHVFDAIENNKGI
jgi:hypothetical protein